MKRVLLLSLCLLALVVIVAPMLPGIVAPVAYGQSLSDAGLHPGTYTFLPRAPWMQDQAQITMTHTRAAAFVDTLVLPGLATTAKIQLTRRTPPLASVMTLRQPTITMVADTLYVSWPAADTCTYDLNVTRRKRY